MCSARGTGWRTLCPETVYPQSNPVTLYVHVLVHVHELTEVFQRRGRSG